MDIMYEIKKSQTQAQVQALPATSKDFFVCWGGSGNKKRPPLFVVANALPTGRSIETTKLNRTCHCTGVLHLTMSILRGQKMIKMRAEYRKTNV